MRVISELKLAYSLCRDGFNLSPLNADLGIHRPTDIPQHVQLPIFILRALLIHIQPIPPHPSGGNVKLHSTKENLGKLFGQKKKEPESFAQAIDGGRRDYTNMRAEETLPL